MKTERITDIVSQDNSSFTRSRQRILGRNAKIQQGADTPLCRERHEAFNEGN